MLWAAVEGELGRMTFWQAVLLGIVQGLTEFLPVSSSGHLVILQNWLGIAEGTFRFDVVVHLGTLVAVLVALRQDWLPIVRDLLGGREGGEGRKRFWHLVVATLPVAVVGLLFKDLIEPLFRSAAAAGLMLLVTGLILWFTDRQVDRSPKARTVADIGTLDALWIGCGQALAVLPGLSRSGSTIGTGLLRGLDRESAARFAFLMAIPAIAGATVLELKDLIAGAAVETIPLVVGFLAALLSGYAAIALFLRFLRAGSLKGFALYTWIVGIVVTLLTLTGGGR